MIETIKDINRKLYTWADTLPDEDKGDNTNPYLIIPDEQYQRTTFKVLALGKETNGWGESENSAHDIGICVSNVALVGYKYGKKGYNTKYSNELFDSILFRNHTIQSTPSVWVLVVKDDSGKDEQFPKEEKEFPKEIRKNCRYSVGRLSTYLILSGFVQSFPDFCRIPKFILGFSCRIPIF